MDNVLISLNERLSIISKDLILYPKYKPHTSNATNSKGKQEPSLTVMTDFVYHFKACAHRLYPLIIKYFNLAVFNVNTVKIEFVITAVPPLWAP